MRNPEGPFEKTVIGGIDRIFFIMAVYPFTMASKNVYALVATDVDTTFHFAEVLVTLNISFAETT